MSAAELSIVSSVITVIGGVIAAAVRWGFGRLIKSMDDNTTALLDVAKNSAILSEKIDHVFDWVVTRSTSLPHSPKAPLTVVKESGK